MAKFLGVDIAGELLKALKGKVRNATLISVFSGTRTPGDLAAGTNPTSTSHAAEGFVDVYHDSRVDGTIIRRGDRLITLLGASIAGGVVPKTNDEVTIDGATYVVVDVKRDPASATYELQGR